MGGAVLYAVRTPCSRCPTEVMRSDDDGATWTDTMLAEEALALVVDADERVYGAGSSSRC
jgi:hypothetical protein